MTEEQLKEIKTLYKEVDEILKDKGAGCPAFKLALLPFIAQACDVAGDLMNGNK